MINISKQIGLFLMMIALLASCDKPAMRTHQDLSESSWQFAQKDSILSGKAKVPGSIHMDLLNNKMIPDPYYRNNENELQWIGEKEWIYTTIFDVEEQAFSKDNIELDFKGLDTYADVYVNDSLILQANNYFREWRVDVKSFLKKKDNTMKIVFHSAVEIEKQKKADSAIPLFDNYVYTRKPAYHYGWDWGPIFVTSGIWQPIVIDAWNNARITNLHIVQNSLTDEVADLSLIYEIEASSDVETTLNVVCSTDGTKTTFDTKLTKGNNTVTVPFKIENPKRWWSHGLGEAFMYNFKTDLTLNGSTVDNIDEKIGLRTIKLVQEPDSIGKSFRFELNGVPVFMKGANYIPQDMFVNRPTEEDYKYVIDQALAANMNMLRVWGGGFYEKDIFYDLCDEKGILVWQDFMFACSLYPGDDAFMENVKQEAIDNVKRLRNHPSIALWCGNNENYIGWKDWRWPSNFKTEDTAAVWKDYENLYEKMLPEIVAELDPTVDYWPSSPLQGWGYPVNAAGDVHYWGVWHAKEPFENFQKPEFIGRFMSEYGMQGCPELSSVKKFTIQEDWDIHSDVMETHQKHHIGYPIIDEYFDRYYKKPKDFEAYLYLSQVQQAFGMQIAIEAHRRAMPHCMGTLYWQINDCYPVTSWASIDVYKKWKALHYRARELYKEVLVSPYVNKKTLEVYVVSDNLKDQNGALELKLYDLSGKVIVEYKKDIVIKANSSHILYNADVANFLGKYKKEDVVLRSRIFVGDKVVAENDFFFVHTKDMDLKKADIKMTSTKVDGGYELTLSSNTFAKDVFLSTEKGEEFFSNNFFDIIPGIDVKVKVNIDNRDFDPLKEIKTYSIVDSY
jgi:beta-mannosidase